VGERHRRAPPVAAVAPGLDQPVGRGHGELHRCRDLVAPEILVGEQRSETGSPTPCTARARGSARASAVVRPPRRRAARGRRPSRRGHRGGRPAGAAAASTNAAPVERRIGAG
jgi:hypothetical protein